MPVDAMSFLRIDDGRGGAAFAIDCRCHRFKVRGINAFGDKAKMVDFQAIGNRAVHQFPRHPVSENLRVRVECESAVSAIGQAGSPEPARTQFRPSDGNRTIAIYLFPEPFGYRPTRHVSAGTYARAEFAIAAH